MDYVLEELPSYMLSLPPISAFGCQIAHLIGVFAPTSDFCSKMVEHGTRAIEIKVGMLLAPPTPKLWYIAVENTGNLSIIRYVESIPSVRRKCAAPNPHRKKSFAADTDAACFLYPKARYVDTPCDFKLDGT